MKKTITKLLDGKLIYILVSLVASFVLWLFVINSVNPSQTQTLTFEVVYEGVSVMEAYNLGLASDNPNTIRLRVEASVTDMNRIQQNQQIIVDVSGIREAGEHDVRFRLATWSTLTGIVTTDPLGLNISNTNDTIIVRANHISRRVFELSAGRVNENIAETEAEDYFFLLERINLEPESVHIDGPEEILDRIAYIKVDANFAEPLTETTTIEGTLHAYDEHGDEIPTDELQDVTVSSDTPFAEARVSVTKVIRMAKNVPLRVEFVYGAGANEENVSYWLRQGQESVESVWLIGEGDVLRGVTDVPLGRIYLARVDIHSDRPETVRREILLPPLTTLYGVADYIDIEIEIDGLEERSFIIPRSQIHFTGRTEGFIPEAAIDTLNIVVRGPVDLLEELDENSISVLVDLSNYAGRTGNILVDTFTVRIGDLPPERIGARDLFGEGIIVNIREA